MPKAHKKFLVGGIAAGILFWFGEAFIHAYLFRTNELRDELVPVSDPNELWMRILISLGFIIFGAVTQRILDELSREKERLEAAHRDLQRAMNEIRTLQGILPICASCKKIRDDTGSWSQIEAYIREHADVEFSHGLCPECFGKAKQELEELKKNRR